MKKKILALVFAAALLSGFTAAAHADFGDYAGDSDYGYDYDYDDYDYYDYDYDYDDDDYDYDYDDDGYYTPSGSYYKYCGYSTGDAYDGRSLLYDFAGSPLGALTAGKGIVTDTDEDESLDQTTKGILVCITIAVIFAIVRKFNGGGPSDSDPSRGKTGKKKAAAMKQTPYRSVTPGAAPTDSASLRNISEYYAVDPGFSEEELTGKLSNMYVQFQNAWQKKDLRELRPYLTDELYARCDRQLESYREKKQTNRIERIAVLGVSLAGWKQQSGNDVMTARLRTRIVDYVVDDETKKVIRGSDTAEKFMEYEWKLVRKTGIKTGTNDGIKVISCPNCGGTVDINKTAKCPYCDSILTVDAADWAVSEIKGLSQRTAGKR